MNDRWTRGIGMTSQRTRDRLVARLQEQGIQDPRVLEVMRNIPRHVFVDEALASRAYEDTALPIGYSQTISRPYTVARMTQALLADGVPQKVLELGTGSGYQTAVLAALVGQVYSVERIEGLYQRARERLHQLNIKNVRLRYRDGSWGWPEHGPFDAIMVTAAPDEVPQSLLEQLALGGRMVIPVGAGKDVQRLLLIVRHVHGFEQHTLESVSFVPFVQGGVV